MRLIEAVGDVIEVHRAVERNKSDLSARIPREIVKLLGNRLTRDIEVSTLLSERRDIEQEEIDGRLGGSQHVLRRRDELDRAGANFGSTCWITVSFTHRIILELFGDCERRPTVSLFRFVNFFAQLTTMWQLK
jgi:hypothetical protein